jgi:hypothetical protein
MVTASKERITRIELGQKAIQSGVITQKEMKGAIIITSLLTLLSAILLIYFAFEDTNILFAILSNLRNTGNFSCNPIHNWCQLMDIVDWVTYSSLSLG